MVHEVDVLICGSGSAGLSAATWLARYGIRCKILESRSGPLEVGQADGVQCRTVEIFESFGIVEELLRESYHVVELRFWSSGEDGCLQLGSLAPDTPLGLSHQPHVILNQARIHSLLLGAMDRFNGQGVDYGYTVKGVEVDGLGLRDPNVHCVTVATENNGENETFKAKYVLACDGAHSAVRKSLGFKMIGDSTDAVWGVMDVYPQTDFPDIRKKTAMQTSAGSLLLIPREGDSMARLYIELPHGTVAKDVKLEYLHATAQRIFHPYKLHIAETSWWSAYAIGQRLADFFSKDDRIFLTGDACHTHSPKAGQGMNVSLQDGYNIGWKLAMVLKGQANPDILKTYNLEREKVAADLIKFDREYSKLFAEKIDRDSDNFMKYHIKSQRYTAGLTSKYEDSMLTSSQQSSQSLASNLVVGMRFPSTQVVRFSDAKAMQLVKALPADGRWRLVVFPGEIGEASMTRRLQGLAESLTSKDGPLHRFTPHGGDIDSFIEVIVVFHGDRLKLAQEAVPDIFWPVTGKWRMRDIHKTFIDDWSHSAIHGKAYEFYGIDPAKGAMAVVRPDHYISLVTAVEDHVKIVEFFEGFITTSGDLDKQ